MGTTCVLYRYSCCYSRVHVHVCTCACVYVCVCACLYMCMCALPVIMRYSRAKLHLCGTHAATLVHMCACACVWCRYSCCYSRVQLHLCGAGTRAATRASRYRLGLMAGVLRLRLRRHTHGLQGGDPGFGRVGGSRRFWEGGGKPQVLGGWGEPQGLGGWGEPQGLGGWREA